MRVTLAVTGCIGAYKAVEILRQLQERKVDVHVIMTNHAQEFVRPLTFQMLSGHPVITDMFEPRAESDIRHISLARSIDLLLVAPATANVLGKFAHGIADDFLTTLYLSATVPVIIAPAMNVEMWKHPATQQSVRILAERGVRFVEPESGPLACGEEGPGRLAAVEQVVAATLRILCRKETWASERVLVTAGPTCEDLDPVRYLTNRSSGKMGYALAEAAALRGADVVLVSGPTSLPDPYGVRCVRVRSAEELHRAVLSHLEDRSLVLAAAAVSDFRPRVRSTQKMKKERGAPALELERTPDVLDAIAQRKGDRFVVGFAAETQDLRANARKKLQGKRLDLVVANDVSRQDSGFEADRNQVVLLYPSGEEEELPLMAKREVAEIVLDRIELLKRHAFAPQTHLT